MLPSLHLTQKLQAKTKLGKVKKAALLLAAAGILYGSVFMSAIDQQAMYEGRKATKQIADLVAGELVAEAIMICRKNCQ